jgi:erythromycin esterase-like protein
VRVTRVSETEFRREDLADVCFVPLLGKEGWEPEAEPLPTRKLQVVPPSEQALSRIIANAAEPFGSIETADLKPLLSRIGDARVVLIGEASHGTSEFYRMRDRISRALIETKGFNFVAIEGDWPDAARIDHYVRHREYSPSEWTAFSRFPIWMWRNNEVRALVDWLRSYNTAHKPASRVAFHGLDLYSLYDSIRFVLKYLDDVDPKSAKVARERYGCLTPWQSDPATYGHAALTGRYPTCEADVAHALSDLLQKHQAYAAHDGERSSTLCKMRGLWPMLSAIIALCTTGRALRGIYATSICSIPSRPLLAYHGEHSKGIVWAHNSHIGNAEATEMTARGEHNIGQLCRREFGQSCYAIGFGTDHGTVAAASEWGGPMEIKNVRPSVKESVERLCHESETAHFMLGLRDRDAAHSKGLLKPRLERAIGVIYRPESELASHYFGAVLPQQFDEYIWLDETRAVAPLKTQELEGLPDTYPFGV